MAADVGNDEGAVRDQDHIEDGARTGQFTKRLTVMRLDPDAGLVGERNNGGIGLKVIRSQSGDRIIGRLRRSIEDSDGMKCCETGAFPVARRLDYFDQSFWHVLSGDEGMGSSESQCNKPRISTYRKETPVH